MLPQIHPETHASCNLVLNEKDSSCPVLLKRWSIFHRSLFPACPAATIVLLARIALHLRGEGQRWQDMFLMDFECFILSSGMEDSYDKKWHDFTTSPPKLMFGTRKEEGGWKMIVLFKQVSFRFHVNFSGCTISLSVLEWCRIYVVVNSLRCHILHLDPLHAVSFQG